MTGNPASSTRARPDFDPAGLLELVGDDREFLDDFVAIFEQDAARLMVEIREAAIGLDGAALERSAHSLKGMLCHFGESPALDLARRLEHLGSSRDLADAEGLASDLVGEVDAISRGLARLVA